MGAPARTFRRFRERVLWRVRRAGLHGLVLDARLGLLESDSETRRTVAARRVACRSPGLSRTRRMNLPNYFLADLPPEATLNKQMLWEACQTLKRNREQYLAERPTRSLVKVLQDIVQNLLD